MPRTTRTEFGHTYKWNPAGLGFWVNTGAGKDVRVAPPSGHRTDWIVFIPGTDVSETLRGKDAEARAFAVAAGLITQPD